MFTFGPLNAAPKVEGSTKYCSSPGPAVTVSTIGLEIAIVLLLLRSTFPSEILTECVMQWALVGPKLFESRNRQIADWQLRGDGDDLSSILYVHALAGLLHAPHTRCRRTRLSCAKRTARSEMNVLGSDSIDMHRPVIISGIDGADQPGDLSSLP